jgi:hypothetical protein
MDVSENYCQFFFFAVMYHVHICFLRILKCEKFTNDAMYEKDHKNIDHRKKNLICIIFIMAIKSWPDILTERRGIMDVSENVWSSKG